MCKKNYTTIVSEINKHLETSGRRNYSDFYVGVSNNAAHRLFSEHHVRKEGSWWIYRTAINANTARDVERHFLELGMRGGTGGGDDASNMVYVYAVEPTTTE